MSRNIRPVQEAAEKLALTNLSFLEQGFHRVVKTPLLGIEFDSPLCDARA